MIHTIEQIKNIAEQYKEALTRGTARILVCAGTGCVASGSTLVHRAFQAELQARGLYTTIDCLLKSEDAGGVTAATSGCHGFCEKGPLVRIEPAGILYTKVKEGDVQEIVDAILSGQPVERLLYHDPKTNEAFAKEHDIPFYKHQTRVALCNCGEIDPDDLRAYLAHDQGYQGIAAALKLTPDEVTQAILKANLRGRGGGGFPAGRKWLIAASQEADQKYIICNGDEGDPGAFMDRSIMEGDPHSVLEGMMIAGYAIGASVGYIYVRAEYPLAVQRLKKAMADAREAGLLGQNILSSNFSFDIQVKEGAGAFVCGEESALIASIEGQRGMPRPKPPFPAVAGLWGKPTIINNVETLANVPRILTKGVEWFQTIGTAKSPGTKTFALTGEVENTGLIEVPMGRTIQEVIFDIGGGIRGGRKFKAVQIGGPSGGCLTEDQLDITLDFDSLQAVGAMIGSGGLVVMDEKTCVVEVARFFMNFIQNESCGKCTFCREGTLQMLHILQRIVDGKGTLADLDLLVEVGETVQIGSLCGLGKTAPNPVVSTLENFREEYLAHIVEKRCPAGVCKSLRRIVISEEECKGCGLCAKVCPVNAISGKPRTAYTVNAETCTKCGACMAACKFNAIKEVS